MNVGSIYESKCDNAIADKQRRQCVRRLFNSSLTTWKFNNNTKKTKVKNDKKFFDLLPVALPHSNRTYFFNFFLKKTKIRSKKYSINTSVYPRCNARLICVSNSSRLFLL